MLEHLAVAALQPHRPAIGHQVHDRGQQHHADSADPRRRVQRDVELQRDDVVHAGEGQQDVERDRRRADRGAGRSVTRALQQVVVGVVAGELLLQERVGDQQGEDQAHTDSHPDTLRDGVSEEVELPRRPQPDQTVGPHHVEVGLAARRHLGRVVGAQVPDRVDLQQATHQTQDAHRDGEERAGLDGEHRHDAHTDHVGLGAAGAGELGVLLEPDQGQVHTDERQDDARDQQDVQRVQARNDDVAGEVAAEQRPVHPGADQRDSHRDARQRRAEAGARQQVVGQRVTEETLEHRQDQQQRPDHPVGFAGASERPGEEDAGQVHHDRGGEQQCRPVVDLSDEQAAANLEADVQRGFVRSGHADAAQRLIDAVVGDVCHRRIEEQRQPHAGEQQHEEAVQRDLTEQERPVRRKDLVQLTADRGGRVVARVDRVTLLGGDLCRAWTWAHDVRSQNAGPTGSMKSPLATKYPSWSIVIGSWARARAAGPKIGFANSSASNCD